jgi:ribose transport system substrate-binding protein
VIGSGSLKSQRFPELTTVSLVNQITLLAMRALRIMIYKGRLIVFVLLFSSIFSAGVGGGEIGVAESPKLIGVLYWSMNIPGQVAMRQGLEQEAKTINATAQKKGQTGIVLSVRIAGDGTEGMERQIEQFYNLIMEQPDAIIVQPTDNAALLEPLRKANHMGIPVIAYDQYISGGELTAYITSDNHQAGYLNGEYLASYFSDRQEIQLILVEYPHVSSTVERLDGFLEALNDYHQPFRILAGYKAVQPEEGRRVAKQILKDFPEPGSIDAIFTVNDGGGLSVVDTLYKANRHEIVVASIDGDPEAIENIRLNRLTHIDTGQFCGVLGAYAMRIAYAVVKGESVPRLTKVPVFPITRETLPIYTGWYGEIPLPFKKPWSSKSPLWTGKVEEIP